MKIKHSVLEYGYDDETATKHAMQWIVKTLETQRGGFYMFLGRPMLETLKTLDPLFKNYDLVLLGNQKPLFRPVLYTAPINLDRFAKLKDAFRYLLNRYSGDPQGVFYQTWLRILNQGFSIGDTKHIYILLDMVTLSNRADRVIEAIHDSVVLSVEIDADMGWKFFNVLWNSINQILYPQYSRIPVTLLAELVRGDNLRHYFNDNGLSLTDSETYRLLTSYSYYGLRHTRFQITEEHVVTQLTKQLISELNFKPRGVITYDNGYDVIPTLRIRSMRVFRWIEYCLKHRREALEKPRRTLAKVELIKGVIIYTSRCLLEVIDEVMDSDITSPTVSVQKVSERVRDRLKASNLEQYIDDHTELYPLAHWMEKLPQSITVLNTPHLLVMEGLEMDHCVGGYIEAVKEGEVILLSIKNRYGRSTVELSQTLDIRQFEGYSGVRPPIRHVELLAKFLQTVSIHDYPLIGEAYARG